MENKECCRCGKTGVELIITKETDRPFPSYCFSCYKLEECDMLYGRGGEIENFFNIDYILLPNGEIQSAIPEPSDTFTF